MKCAKCNTQVSIADRRCPQCDSDLLQFGATISYESKRREAGAAKEMFFGELRREFDDNISDLDPNAKKIFQPVASRLKRLFTRQLSDTEVEVVFDREIMPEVEDLAKDRGCEELLQKVEKEIRERLGDHAFYHYQHRGVDVLKILRAGEIACLVIDAEGQAVDLSIKMFPFFKASEKACSIHTKDRYGVLRKTPVIKEIDDWVWNHWDEISIEDIPGWLDDRKKTLAEVVHGIIVGNEYHTGGSLRTGIALYMFGRDWTLKVAQGNLGQTKTFQISNILNAQGSDKEKESLAYELNELQKLRNERMHKDVEDEEKMVRQSRDLSYGCLRQIPKILGLMD